jgi:hypothetical protein
VNVLVSVDVLLVSLNTNAAVAVHETLLSRPQW